MEPITINELGELLKMSIDECERLDFPIHEDGCYDVMSCFHYYIEHLKSNRVKEYLDAETMGEIFGVTSRRIQQYSDDEGMPKFERGKYDLKECAQWMVKKLKEENEILKNSGSSPMHQEKLKEMQMKNVDRKIRQDIMLGTYVKKESVLTAWADEMQRIMKSVKALVYVLDYRLENVTEAVKRRTIIDEETNRTLKDLSDLKIESDMKKEQVDYLQFMQADENNE
jgi:hypothetical protein